MTSFDKQGNVEKITTYKNGIKNGLERIIENNILHVENYYVDGKLNGICKTYGEKYLEAETTFKDGKREGIQKIYKPDGSWEEIPYVNDVKKGEGTEFYPNKSVHRKITYRYDAKNGISKSFYPNGNLLSVERYKDDKLSGVARYFDDEGNLQLVRYFVDGTMMADINMLSDPIVSEIYQAYQEEKLVRFSQKKNLWYPILWLGLNQEKHEILDILTKDMNMYAASLGNENVYRKFGKAKFKEYNRKLFFGMSPLSYALHLDANTALLQNFINEINLPNERGTTPLHEAIELDDAAIVKYLLLNHANPNAVNAQNETVLFDAMKGKANLDIIALLLGHGADVNSKDVNGYSPLMIAIRKQNATLANLLLKNGAAIDELTPDGKNMLFYAYTHEAPQDILQTLLEANGNINLKDKSGNFILMTATQNNDVDFVKSLLEKRADVNLTDSSGNSVLSYVLSNENVDEQIRDAVITAGKNFKGNLPKFNKSLWNVLLDQNDLPHLSLVWKAMGNIDKPDNNHVNPLYTAIKTPEDTELLDLALSFVQKADVKLLWKAVESQNLDFLQKVLQKEAPVNEKNTAGETVLTYMIKNKFGLEFLKAVENVKPDINLQNKDNQDALELAVQDSNVEVAQNLLANGADINRVINGKTYLMGFDTTQTEMTKLFIQNKADLNAMFEGKRTMLMIAVEQLNLPLFDALLENNVDVKVRDDDSNTALFYLSEALKKYPDMTETELKNKFTHIIKGLQDKGIDINIQNSSGETLLMLIAQNSPDKFEMMSSFLAEFGLSADLKNQYGKTAAELIKTK